MDGAPHSVVARPLVSAGASVALRDVTKWYQNVGAVRGVSLDIESASLSRCWDRVVPARQRR